MKKRVVSGFLLLMNLVVVLQYICAK